MLLILLSWIYIFLLLGSTGTILSHFLDFKKSEPVIVVLLGLFGITIAATIFAFFYRIHWEFHLIILLLNFGFYFFKRKITAKFFKNFYQQLKQFSSFSKLLLFSVFILTLAQCAAAPFVLDNESYYIQTIKWINEHGFVPGLSNLHFFLGQTSGWHIAQAALNFNFIYGHFNDLSGFCLLLGNYFAISRLQLFFQNRKPIDLAAGFFIMGNLLFFQFIGAPSPDIPVIVFSFILFFLVIENWDFISSETILSLTIISLFILLIKPTAVSIVLLPAFLFFFKWKNGRRIILPTLALGFLVAILFMLKNIIFSGYPLFPTSLFNYADVDWKLPLQLQEYYYSHTKAYGFLLTPEQLEQLSLSQKFLHWLSLPKLHGLFNKLSILVLLICFFFFRKIENKKPLYILYFLAVFQFILLLSTSPQYRFFLNYLVFFGCIIAAVIFINSKILKPLLVIGVLLPVIPLFFPLSLSGFSDNEYTQNPSTFQLQEILVPHENSRYYTEFSQLKEGNLLYHHPEKIDFFWATGNGPLPCVNRQQINYFKSAHKFLPQLRSIRLKDGFYSKKIAK